MAVRSRRSPDGLIWKFDGELEEEAAETSLNDPH
jgi:hypothetical protein